MSDLVEAISRIEGKIDALSGRFDSLEQKSDARFGSLDKKTDAALVQLGSLDKKTDAALVQLGSLDSKSAAILDRLSAFQIHVDKRFYETFKKFDGIGRYLKNIDASIQMFEPLFKLEYRIRKLEGDEPKSG